MGSVDQSVPISNQSIEKLNEVAYGEELLMSFSGHPETLSRDYMENFRSSDIELNNRFMKQVQQELKKQGVSSSLVKSKIEPSAFNLRLDSVEKNGNRLAQKYLRAAKKVDSAGVYFSVVEGGTARGFNSFEGEAFFDYETLLALLKKEKELVIPHELRHQMFNKQRAAGISSVFDHEFHATGTSRGLNSDSAGMYDDYMILEEVYNHSSDLAELVKDYRKLSKIPRSIDKFVESKKAVVLGKIKSTGSGVGILSRNTKETAEYMLKEVDELKISLDGKDRMIVAKDTLGREFKIRLNKTESIEDLSGLRVLSLSDLDQAFDYFKGINLSAYEMKTVKKVDGFMRTNPNEEQWIAFFKGLNDSEVTLANRHSAKAMEFKIHRVGKTMKKRVRETLERTRLLGHQVEKEITKIKEVFENRSELSKLSEEELKEFVGAVNDLRTLVRDLNSRDPNVVESALNKYALEPLTLSSKKITSQSLSKDIIRNLNNFELDNANSIVRLQAFDYELYSQSSSGSVYMNAKTGAKISYDASPGARLRSFTETEKKKIRSAIINGEDLHLGDVTEKK